MFVNCWAGNNSLWDIDCFVTFEGRLVAFEVKQKYPTQNGTYGLNTGLVKLFLALERAGIPVIHIILKKPVNDYKIPAIDLITLPKYREKSQWIGTRYQNEILTLSESKAPARTSISGSDELSFYEIPENRFHFLKMLGDKESLLPQFLNAVV
ncbi:hypothetical protein [Nibrella saemangeumensis]